MGIQVLTNNDILRVPERPLFFFSFRANFHNIFSPDNGAGAHDMQQRFSTPLMLAALFNPVNVSSAFQPR